MTDETTQLLELHFETAFDAPDGIEKLRELILTLAMRGALTEKKLNDQPASELLEHIKSKKEKLIKEGKLKKNKMPSLIERTDLRPRLPESWQWSNLETIM